MPELTLDAVRYDSGFHVRIRLDKPIAGGALLLSVTGPAGSLVVQERLPLPRGAVAIDHLVETAESPLRVKVVLLVGDEVITQQRADLHISMATFES
ncbi:MAG TPA: hypothetical protein VK191_09865 [Symbiobacteriaceae bacterium]|nr:hypothetical protein [Symbiobacteriaceae bacterium]